MPDTFGGETSWEYWKLHFEDVAAVNEWTDEQKLKWLCVHLTRHAQKAFHRLPEHCIQERLEPKRKTRHQAELESRRKKCTEGGPISPKISRL